MVAWEYLPRETWYREQSEQSVLLKSASGQNLSKGVAVVVTSSDTLRRCLAQVHAVSTLSTLTRLIDRNCERLFYSDVIV